LGALLAFGAIFATYNVFYLSRPIKDLEISVDTTVSLVSVSPEAVGNIQVFYDGKEVKNVQLLQIIIKNRGNQPILESDFVRPITFSFESLDEIVDISVIESQPNNIGVMVNKINNYQANISPVLLNPGDTTKIRFIVIKANCDPIINNISIDGRIVGINNVKITVPEVPQSSKAFYSVIIAGLLGIILTIISSFIFDGLKNLENNITKKIGPK
jgi:hypothetical protein